MSDDVTNQESLADAGQGQLAEIGRETIRRFWHDLLRQPLKPFREEVIPYQHNP